MKAEKKYSVRLLTDEEKQTQRMLGENHYKWLEEHPRKDYIPVKEKIIFMQRRCTFSRCQNQSSYMLTYQYVFRSGKRMEGNKAICEHHAQKYLKG